MAVMACEKDGSVTFDRLIDDLNNAILDHDEEKIQQLETLINLAVETMDMEYRSSGS